MASYLLPTMLSLCLIFCLHFSSATQSKMEIRMPNLRPSVEDYYVCTSIKVPSETYITQYEALADAGTAHHILLFGCYEPFSYDSSCDKHDIPSIEALIYSERKEDFQRATFGD
ncbi:hypothetical protein EB796_019756 [Bugula neritina]|uniref:Copper type II ascorbate-dependent monooxygenase N-terminal domain-containing protein n=1 Tax=Bugula neritina TaxID=10212 RepID=A0A7J7J741_BUGNE|nr:hypothetical protein EB796_019756 [Bugula neritina]